ncbi:tetratricopeptide repeat protein [Antribacter sp. KLBMP9083]|uniref:Tetratricopeptide repeat protein n=1 Tax=Antribacter soli TaxID=2910976 RepID=A0AA41U8K7_9MICO|nr:tetratricopeptide repeat protein [Antribacter soli]MCF4123103.1 tetratricopeptide repeat protein [Antribacter soli]
MSEGRSDVQVNLRPLRLRAMLTQEELAFKAGVGTRTIRDIESGRARPQPKTLRLLIEALGLDEADRTLLSSPPEGTPPVPRELPRALAGFVGRERHVDALFTAINDGATVVTVHGMAGVGKTSLVVWAAHALAPRFPDGQLFVDLHGATHSGGPRPGLQSVLTRLLRRLGVGDRDLPAEVDEMTARYRSVIASRRVLLVLDNATDAEQVEALLPGTPESLVVATSRRDLSQVAGAYRLLLDPPAMPEAVAMLGAAVTDRITVEEAAAIAERCGRLPLAMSLAAARLRSRPNWQAEDLLARLADDDRLLSELDMRHSGVAAALSASYLELDAEHRRMFRRLGLVPGDDVDARAAAALCEVTEEQAVWMLENLVDVHLVESRSPGRYRMHDLVRVYAMQLAGMEEPEAERDEAFVRLVNLYLHFAYRAANQVSPTEARILAAGVTAHDLGLPGFADKESAISWFRAERTNLVAAVSAAERSGRLEPAWHLATAFTAFRLIDRDHEEYLTINRIALDIARRLHDESKEAHTLADRGRHLLVAGRCQEAVSYLERAATLFRELDDITAAAFALRNIGIAHRQSGRFAEALDVYRSALALAEAASDTTAMVVVGANMVVPLLRLGRLSDAEHCLSETEQLVDVSDQYNRLRIENFRGTVLRERGDPAAALLLHIACLERCRRMGFRGGLSPILIELGTDLVCLDRGAEAAVYLSQAVEDAEDLGYPSLVRTALIDLGRALALSSRFEEAVGHFERAAGLAESHEDAYELARANHGLADAHRSRGDADAERQHLHRAARAYADCGVPEAAMIHRDRPA